MRWWIETGAREDYILVHSSTSGTPIDLNVRLILSNGSISVSKRDDVEDPEYFQPFRDQKYCVTLSIWQIFSRIGSLENPLGKF